MAHDEQEHFELSIETLLDSENIADHLEESQLDDIGQTVVAEFEEDKESRKEWEKNMEQARKLALQVSEDKNFPWPQASNIKFPLITIAANQFQSRVYPETVGSTDIVKARTVRSDDTGDLYKRATRVADHMNYQILEEDVKWEEEHDKALMVLPIMGCVFKKTYYDPSKGHNVSEYVLPTDLVVPYYARSLEEAARKTHVLEMSPRDIKERQLGNLYRDVELKPSQDPEDSTKRRRKEEQGLTPPTTDVDRPYQILEQHRFLDLDGDGYPEPYVVTVEAESKIVLRILARFDEEGIFTDMDEEIAREKELLEQELNTQWMTPEEQVEALNDSRKRIQGLINTATVLRITPFEFFTKYSFIPSPTGSFYDIGFGSLLGPINAAVDSLINQLVDSGTLQNSAGGFIGRGVNLRGGNMRFKPYEWKRVDTIGADLRENIMPLPVNQPSHVLFQLLNLLINYGERTSSVTDMMQGITPGQNTPATTSMNALEQGQMVFSAIYKRVYRGMKQEFRKLYELNARYMTTSMHYRSVMTGAAQDINPVDYAGGFMDIAPAADPSVESRQMKIQKAQALIERSQMSAGYNLPVIERRFLKALDVDGIDEVFPTDEEGNPTIQPPPDPQAELDMAEQERKQAETQAKIEKMRAETVISASKADYEIAKLQADAMYSLERAISQNDQRQIDKIKTDLSAMKERRDSLQQMFDMEVALDDRQQQSPEGGGMGSMGDEPNHQEAPGTAGGEGRIN